MLWLLGAPAGDWRTLLLGGLLTGAAVAPCLGQHFYSFSTGSTRADVAGSGLALEQCVGIGALAGSWLFCAPLPLDWGSRWQEWAYSPIMGLFHGYIAGAAYWLLSQCTRGKAKNRRSD